MAESGKKKPAKKEKLYLVISAVEMQVEELEDREALAAKVADVALALGIPIDQLPDSGVVKAFVGNELTLAVERPQLRIE